jgi:hypothetical protein
MLKKKTQYMVMSRDQNAGRGHKIKFDNCSFERQEEFRHLGTTLKNQNSMQEEIKKRVKAGNVFVFQFAIQKYKH